MADKGSVEKEDTLGKNVDVDGSSRIVPLREHHITIDERGAKLSLRGCIMKSNLKLTLLSSVKAILTDTNGRIVTQGTPAEMKMFLFEDSYKGEVSSSGKFFTEEIPVIQTNLTDEEFLALPPVSSLAKEFGIEVPEWVL
jgi:hypothetical protein